MRPPEPSDAIPDFLFEKFNDLSPETLRGVADYARRDTYVAPDEMPDSLIESFALQDEETLEAIATYVDELAAFLEEEGADSLRELIGDSSDEDETWGQQQLREWHEQ
ncbi:hypothetical protein HYG81_09805 [Natrinema zhouii]|uniref:Uncharacterized protein n=1 Tax=Natrinema zhouii TaxID=1710539 RepID=A0A7D6GIG0_9EURY|nr:hypothetical protein [Natrinema zhouii]QLK24419.1 hypothetical protein HYG81_09805 [Natrinema zhouii]